MRDIYQYFDWVDRVLEDAGAEEIEVDYFRDDAQSGLINGVVYFHDGSRLEITEAVKLEQGKPVKVTYVYQCVREGESVFRYDNAPHHPGLSNFPHHKHVGAQRLSALEPSLKQVLGEVAGYFTDTLATKPKRRRQSKQEDRSDS